MPKIKYKEANYWSIVLNSKLLVFLSNFIFQGVRYMSLGERVYKLSITALFATLMFFLTENIFVSIFIAHLINYIINGQFYVLYRYLGSKPTMSIEALNKYVKIIENLADSFKPLDILIIGSFCRGRLSKTSDLDIRLYHMGDFRSSLRAYFMATLLRFIGLWTKFPVDIFCFSNLNFLLKIDTKETPVNFFKNQKILDNYPNSTNYKDHLRTLRIT